MGPSSAFEMQSPRDFPRTNADFLKQKCLDYSGLNFWIYCKKRKSNFSGLGFFFFFLYSKDECFLHCYKLFCFLWGRIMYNVSLETETILHNPSFLEEFAKSLPRWWGYSFHWRHSVAQKDVEKHFPSKSASFGTRGCAEKKLAHTSTTWLLAGSRVSKGLMGSWGSASDPRVELSSVSWVGIQNLLGYVQWWETHPLPKKPFWGAHVALSIKHLSWTQ